MAAVIWLTFSIMCGNLIYLKIRKALSLLVVMLLVIAYVPNYCNDLKENIQMNKETNETLQIVNEIDTDKKITLTSNIEHLYWTVFDYYFPDSDKMVCSFEENWKMEEDKAVLFFSYCMLENDETYNSFIKKYNYISEYKYHSRFAGYEYYLYMITDQ